MRRPAVFALTILFAATSLFGGTAFRYSMASPWTGPIAGQAVADGRGVRIDFTEAKNSLLEGTVVISTGGHTTAFYPEQKWRYDFPFWIRRGKMTFTETGDGEPIRAVRTRHIVYDGWWEDPPAEGRHYGTIRILVRGEIWVSRQEFSESTAVPLLTLMTFPRIESFFKQLGQSLRHRRPLKFTCITRQEGAGPSDERTTTVELSHFVPTEIPRGRFKIAAKGFEKLEYLQPIRPQIVN